MLLVHLPAASAFVTVGEYCHLERATPLCALCGGLVGRALRTDARPALHVDGLPLPSK